MDLSIRTLVRGLYDVQKQRIQTGNRIVAQFKAKLGQLPSASEETLSPEARGLLERIRRAERKVTTGAVSELEAEKAKKDDVGKLVVDLMDIMYAQFVTEKGKIPPKSKFVGNPVVSNYTEMCLICVYKEQEAQEAAHFRRLESVLEDFPIWTQYLKGIRGCGPAMAGVILSEIDIHKAQYASSLWSYAGLDVVNALDPETLEVTGQGRSRRETHLVRRKYINRDGQEAERNSITFNPFLKTKLVGVLGSSFLRAGGPYADVYRNYKARLQNMEDHKGKTKQHIHNMAIRYAVKRFLADLYVAWRTLEGLPVTAEYHEGKLGHVHAAKGGVEC